jgi:hypothetical protein
MLKNISLILVFIGMTISLFSASNQLEASDSFNELETGNLSLYFYNALNGAPISDATVELTGIGTFKTDHNGAVNFEPQEDNYIQTVKFTADKYISSVFDVEIMVGTVFFNRYSISPVMNIDNFRVVIDWDKSPADLDAHFQKTGDYHLSYRNQRTLSDGRGQLDRDDTNGFGPETITVSRIEQNSNYEYFIEDYTNRSNDNSKALGKSKATVKVYGNGQLLNVFKVPQKMKGNVWKVFRIENGKIIQAY